ncbi:MAG: hypothetical protein LBC39_01600 [Methanobrevibacter sp.]|jgi:chromosome segregation ATPase|nr:hypothetical protein [Candidatus Methanovirga aequatorialis]
MDHVEGTVKKYIREYSRILKNGKKKKYQTEQVQITLSKKNDIFQDEEEVVVMNKEAFKEYEKLSSTIEKQKNIIYSLKKELETFNNNQEGKLEENGDELNKSCISLKNENDSLKKRFNSLQKEIKHYKYLNEKLREFILKLT